MTPHVDRVLVDPLDERPHELTRRGRRREVRQVLAGVDGAMEHAIGAIGQRQQQRERARAQRRHGGDRPQAGPPSPAPHDRADDDYRHHGGGNQPPAEPPVPTVGKATPHQRRRAEKDLRRLALVSAPQTTLTARSASAPHQAVATATRAALRVIRPRREPQPLTIDGRGARRPGRTLPTTQRWTPSRRPEPLRRRAGSRSSA